MEPCWKRQSLDRAKVTRAGLDGFGSDTCDLCHVKFDAGDAKIWWREVGKVHFTCFMKWKSEKLQRK